MAFMDKQEALAVIRQIKLLYLRKADSRQEWNSILHHHPYTELFYILEGQGKLQLADQVRELKKGDLFLVGPDLPHREFILPKGYLSYYVMGIENLHLESEEALSEDAINYRSFQSLFFSPTKSVSFALLFEQLDQAQRSQGPYADEILQRLLEVFFLQFLYLSESPLTLQEDLTPDHQLQFAKEYLDVHYAANISLDRLANRCYLNKYYLSHAFQKRFGISPIAYLLRRRLEAACQLLKTTSMTMLEISSAVGFNSQSYFNKAFKEVYSCTPGQYRRRQ